MLKRIAVILAVISLFASTLVLNAQGLNIKIDGYANERAWLDCHTQVLVSSRNDSNNDVSFALANILYDEENHRIYISLKANVDGEVIIPEQTTTAPPVIGTTQAVRVLHGARISVDNSDFVGIFHDGVEDYNTTLYYIDGAVSEFDAHAFGVEICLGVKLGLDSLDNIRVELVDGNGVPSNAYTLYLPPLPSEETTTASYFSAESTACVTTTDNTTRITTTQRTTVRATTARTTVRSTVSVPSETAGTTTQKEKTTRQKTTAAVAAENPVTVYVTVPQSTAVAVDATTVSDASSVQSGLSEQSDNKEMKYAAAAGLIILIFGLCVIINSLNSKDSSNK